MLNLANSTTKNRKITTDDLEMLLKRYNLSYYEDDHVFQILDGNKVKFTFNQPFDLGIVVNTVWDYLSERD